MGLPGVESRAVTIWQFFTLKKSFIENTLYFECQSLSLLSPISERWRSNYTYAIRLLKQTHKYHFVSFLTKSVIIYSE